MSLELLWEAGTMDVRNRRAVALLLILGQFMVLCSGRSITSEEREECFDKHPFDHKEEIRNFIDRKDVAREMKCFFWCQLQGQGVMTESGEISENAPMEIMPLWGGKMSHVTKTSLTCYQKAPSGDPCDTAYKMTTCLFAVQQSLMSSNNMIG